MILRLLKMHAHVCVFNFKCVYVKELMQQTRSSKPLQRKDIKNSSLDILHICYDAVFYLYNKYCVE